MYKVLVVDDDTTSLLVMRACLENWTYYEVTTTDDAREALNMLYNNSYDLILTEVHMPHMTGFQLQERINKEFSLPLIFMSADTRDETIGMGMKIGAQAFLQKPIVAEDVKHIYQFCEWWKSRNNNNIAPVMQVPGSSQSMIRSHNDNSNNNVGGMSFSDGHKIGRLNWTSDLHNRFMEAILVLGYERAVATNIWEVMNVQGLTKNHVASHLQKFQKFLKDVMKGKRRIDDSDWIDLNYYSSIVSGNPTRMLISQLQEQQRKGQLAEDNPLRPPRPEHIKKIVRAPNAALSSWHPPLPPFTIPESSNISMNASLTSNNDACSFVNVTSMGLVSATRGTVGSNTSSIRNLSHETNQMGYYGQNTVAQEQNNFISGELVEGANNNLFTSTMDVCGQDINNFFNTNNFNTHQELDGREMTGGSYFNNNGFNSTVSNQVRTPSNFCWPNIEFNEDDSNFNL